MRGELRREKKKKMEAELKKKDPSRGDSTETGL
jgi:hypothetical protein